MRVDPSIIVVALPLAVVAVLGYIFLLKRDERWILAAIPIHLVVFLEKTESINANKLIYTLFFFPALFIWFFRKWVKGEKVVKRKEDMLLVLFLFFSLASVIWATFQHHDSFFRGMREFYIFVPYLFYFPIKEYVTDSKKLNRILWTLLITCTLGAFYVIYIFKSATIDAAHIWNVLWSRKNLSEPLYMTAIIILLAMVATRAYKPWLTLPLLGINILSLGLTMTRGYWVATALGTVMLVLFLKGRARTRLVLYLVGGFVLFTFMAAVVFPKIFAMLVAVLSMRVTSISLGSESLQDRLIESVSVISGIKASPIIGNGLGSEFSFYEILKGYTLTTYYIHNDYLYLLYKLGITGAAIYLSFYVSKLFAAARTTLKANDEHLRAMLLSMVAILAVMMIVTVTSPQFNDKVPVLIITILWGSTTGIGNSLAESEPGS